jgi:ribosomal protein S18 acetylase RimI-like enzyme
MFTAIKASELSFDPRSQIAELFAEGFIQWLEFFSKDKKVIEKAFAHMFILDRFYVAVDGNKVAGVVGCSDGYSSSVRLEKKELKTHLGFIKGSLAGMFLKEWEGGIKNPNPSKGSIEFVGTAKEYQGRGVATLIFKHILDNTPYTEYVINEVADTNTPAMKLYEKWGFEEYDRRPVPSKRAKRIGINNFLSLKYYKHS